MKEPVIKNNILKALSVSEPRTRASVMRDSNFDKLSANGRAAWERIWVDLIHSEEITDAGASERGVVLWVRTGEPQDPQPSEGSVYLVGNRSLSWYKIGLTYNPIAKRFRGIQNGVPFQVELLAHQRVGQQAEHVEAHLHSSFSQRRVRGEWFCNVTPNQFYHEVAIALSTPEEIR